MSATALKPIVVEATEQIKTTDEILKQTLQDLREKLSECDRMVKDMRGLLPNALVQAEAEHAITLAPAELRVRSQRSYEQAWETCRSIQYVLRESEEVFEGTQKQAHKLHVEIKALRDVIEDPVRSLKEKLVKGIGDFYLECQERWRKLHGDAGAGAIVPTTLEKMPGGSVRPKVTPKVTDLEAFARWCLKNKTESLGLLGVNESALKKRVASLGEAVAIPGVEIERGVTVSVQAWKA